MKRIVKVGMSVCLLMGLLALCVQFFWGYEIQACANLVDYCQHREKGCMGEWIDHEHENFCVFVCHGDNGAEVSITCGDDN
jgi:hypothetical protein